MKVVWLAHYSVHLEVRLVKAPYRGINKLPAEPVVMIALNTFSAGKALHYPDALRHYPVSQNKSQRCKESALAKKEDRRFHLI